MNKKSILFLRKILMFPKLNGIL